MSEPLVLRPEIYRDQVDSSSFGVVEKPLSTWERIYNQSAVRKVFILIMLAVLWEIYARLLNNALLFPTFTSTIDAFFEAVVRGGLLGKAWTSIKVLLIGYSAGIALAALLFAASRLDAWAIVANPRLSAREIFITRTKSVWFYGRVAYNDIGGGIGHEHAYLFKYDGRRRRFVPEEDERYCRNT